MSVARRFEDFIAWQKARVLTREIYAVTSVGQLARDFGLKDQLQRSSVSIMANIAEGFERSRPTEFHQFLSIAKSSCAELRSELYVAFDAGYITEEDFERLRSSAEEVGRLVGGLRASVDRQRANPTFRKPT
jgi:four helix bundle protein